MEGKSRSFCCTGGELDGAAQVTFPEQLHHEGSDSPARPRFGAEVSLEDPRYECLRDSLTVPHMKCNPIPAGFGPEPDMPPFVGCLEGVDQHVDEYPLQ